MENKSTSDAPGASEDATAALRSTTNVPPKRTIVKPTTSKLSSLARPTSTSAARTSTAASTLNKPPTRPTVTSSIKKPKSTTISSGLASGHQKRTSVSSVDTKASGDEKKPGGLSARPKRMSLAPSTSTSSTKPLSSTLSRRSTIQPSPTSERKPFVRQSTSSPAKTRTPTTPSSRTVTGSATRTRPVPSSSLKNAGVAADGKKRLSTIPASPAIKTEPDDEDKENVLQSVPEAEDDEMALAVEHEGADSADDGESARTLERPERAPEDEGVIESLKAELSESQSMVGNLTAELEEWKDKLAAFSASAEEESRKVEEATEAIRNEHAAKIESMSDSHDQELSAVKTQLEEAKTDISAHEQYINTLGTRQESHDSALEALKQIQVKEIDTIKQSHANDLSALQTSLDESSNISTNAASQHDSEVAKLNEVIETLQNEILKRHESQAKEADERVLAIRDEHEAAMSKALGKVKATSSDELETLRKSLSAEFEAQVDGLQKELAHAQESARKDSEERIRALEAQSRSTSSDLQAAKMQTNTLKSILSSLEKESQEKDEEHAKALAKEKEDVETSIKRMTEQQMKFMDAQMRLDQEEGKRNALEKVHAKAISDMKAEYEAGRIRQDNARGVEFEALKRQHADHLEEFSQKEANLTKKIEKTQSQHADLNKSFKAQGESHSQAITKLTSQHETAVKNLEDTATAREQELEMLKSSHASASKAVESSHAQALEDLQTKHTEALKGLQVETGSQTEELKQFKAQQGIHAEKIKSMESAHMDELEKLKAEHTKKTGNVQAAAEAKDAEMEAVKLQHAEMLRELKTSSAGKDGDYESLETRYADLEKDLKALESAHLVHLEEVRARHTDAFNEMKAKADNHETELTKFKAQHEQLTKYAESSKNDHTEALEEMKSQHANQVKTLKASVDTQAAEANKWRTEHGHAVKGAITKADYHARELEDFKARHLEELRSAKVTSDKHASEVERLKSQHSTAVESATGAQTTALADANSRIAELRKELEKATDSKNAVESSQTELRSELNGALLEVQTQRSMAERLREDAKGVDDVMKGLRDRAAALEAEVVEAKKAPKPKRKSGSKKKSGSPTTPGANGSNPGLAESKWAETPKESGEVDKMPELRGGSGGEEVAEKKHDIEGKLAGFQQQLKQLDDINGEFLDEHEKLARTLNRVDDKPAVASADQ